MQKKHLTISDVYFIQEKTEQTKNMVVFQLDKEHIQNTDS